MSSSTPTMPTAKADDAPDQRGPSYNDDDEFFATLSSIMRVTVAGFGGALAGLSFARRGGGGGAAASALSRTSSAGAASARTNARTRSIADGTKADKAARRAGAASDGGRERLRRQRPVIRSAPPTARPYVDRELPVAWALACTAFAGIVEMTRVLSPTSVMLKLTNDQWGDGDFLSNDDSSLHVVESGRDEPLGSQLVTVSDYVVGGAMAGAIFKGSAVRTQAGARMDASIAGASTASKAANLSALKGRPLLGLIPGAGLGLLAGLSVVAVEHAQVVVDDYFGRSDGLTHQGGGHVEREDISIPADIKAMSNEELARSIENLTRGEGESHDEIVHDNDQGEGSSAQSTNELETQTENHDGDDVPDLLQAIGFRPHSPE
ncbi:hypothetical protein ACHAWF_012795 [Thalassiosira exigua]